MTTSLDKICNYSVDTKTTYQPTIAISYIDRITEDEDIMLREVKRINRELAIDIILDNKDESEWGNRSNLPNGEYTTTKTSFFSVNTRAQKFTSFKDLEYDVFNKLENLTKDQPSFIKYNLNLTLPNDNDLDAFRKRVLTKISMCSHLIASNSYKGGGDTIIVGKNVIQYIQSYEEIIDNTSIFCGMNLIVTPYIDPDKIIVIRCENIPGVGLNVIVKPNDSVFYMVETPQSWEKVIKWFWIK